MLFHEWAPFHSIPWCRHETNFDSLVYNFAGAPCLAGWKPVNWTTRNLIESRLSPAQTEALRVQDITRCTYLLLQVERMVAYYTAKRKLLIGRHNADVERLTEVIGRDVLDHDRFMTAHAVRYVSRNPEYLFLKEREKIYEQNLYELSRRRGMWLLRLDYMKQRVEAAGVLFPPHVAEPYLRRRERRITLAKALHPRVVSLGACQLSRLDAALVERIAALSELHPL